MVGKNGAFIVALSTYLYRRKMTNIYLNCVGKRYLSKLSTSTFTWTSYLSYNQKFREQFSYMSFINTWNHCNCLLCYRLKKEILSSLSLVDFSIKGNARACDDPLRLPINGWGSKFQATNSTISAARILCNPTTHAISFWTYKITWPSQLKFIKDKFIYLNSVQRI